MDLIDYKKKYNEELKSLKKADKYFADNPDTINISAHFINDSGELFIFASEGVKLLERYNTIISNLSKLIDEIERNFNIIVSIEEKEEGFNI